jgi:UDP-glucose 4-epimerase
MKNVLVTGGTGFIGAALVKNLVNKGFKVKTFDNNSRGGLDKLDDYLDRIEVIEGDIRDLPSVMDAMKGIDIVYHLAFINGTRYFYEKPDLVLEVGLKGMLNVMDAAMHHKVKRMIYASSAEVYQQPTHIPTNEDERLIIPDPRNPRYSYGGAKAIGEVMALHYAKHSDLETVIFRPHNIYGPNMGFEHVIPEFVLRMKEMSDNFSKSDIEFPIQGTGEETRAFCYVEDAAEGIALVAEHGKTGEIYHVGTEEEVTISKLVEIMGNQLGVAPKIQPTEIPKGATNRRCPSIARARTLGYSPKVTLEQGVKITSEWYKKVER